jgi:hypothetical protein
MDTSNAPAMPGMKFECIVRQGKSFLECLRLTQNRGVSLRPLAVPHSWMLRRSLSADKQLPVVFYHNPTQRAASAAYKAQLVEIALFEVGAIDAAFAAVIVKSAGMLQNG